MEGLSLQKDPSFQSSVVWFFSYQRSFKSLNQQSLKWKDFSKVTFVYLNPAQNVRFGLCPKAGSVRNVSDGYCDGLFHFWIPLLRKPRLYSVANCFCETIVQYCK